MSNTVPAKAPITETFAAAQLQQLGDALRIQRKRLGVNATTAAEAAGLSRVTLHRIERGEPSVTMGAYLNAASALGLNLRLAPVVDETAVREPVQPKQRPSSSRAHVRLADYPQLRLLAWQRNGDAELTPAEALSVYERNWRHVDQQNLSVHEHALIEALVTAAGRSRLLV